MFIVLGQMWKKLAEPRVFFHFWCDHRVEQVAAPEGGAVPCTKPSYSVQKGGRENGEKVEGQQVDE